ncbi:MAG: ribokinase [Clostridia bacterium]|nr:ribokinase [Clostridia bacterium]
MKNKILVVSSANMDMVLDIDRVPNAGQTVIDMGSYTYVPGGKGANSALAFARLGGNCTFLTRVGSDANGEALVSLYEREGINTSYIKKDESAPTGLATIFVEKSGQNRIIVFAGANQKIDTGSIDCAMDSDIDALYMQFEINYDAILYSAKKASEKGVPIFIDAGAIKRDFPFEALPELEIFSPNESEAYEITGIMPDSDKRCLDVALALSKLVCAKYIVIKLGGRGAYVFDGANGKFMPTYDIEVVDTTAAGDAFTAGLTLEYLRCGDIYRACEFANATGTLTVSRKGASSSIPSETEVEAFLKSVK